MEKNQIGSMLVNAGNAAKGALDKAKEKTVQVIDQNDDGKFDISDIAISTSAVGGVLKRGVSDMKDGIDEIHKQYDLKRLNPIFAASLSQTDFYFSKLIRVLERGKKYAENNACNGAIGYFFSARGGLKVANIFKDSIDAVGLSFYPNNSCEFYYQNPCDRNNYIALDEYFNYLQEVRISELQCVAQDLGAKHFKVTYKEERTSFSKVNLEANINALGFGTAEGKHESSKEKYSINEVKAELQMVGHAPKEPKLVYLSNDESVKNLIKLRVDGGDNLQNHKISINMSKSSGISVKDAEKIDAALKVMKVSGNTTVVSEARNESRRYLEYEIDF